MLRRLLGILCSSMHRSRFPSLRVQCSLDSIRAKHRGDTIAILGSGPSLASFTGAQSIAIAVNGAAFSKIPYHYFVCGDALSPQRSWFLASTMYDATRIVSSFVAPHDPLLFPAVEVRRRLQRQTAFDLYEYEPDAMPTPPHLWFQYESAPISRFDQLSFDASATRLFHGATITGVALQLAVIMGAKEIHLYGCDFSNRTGFDYLLPTTERGGVSTELQRRSFQKLVDAAQRRGVRVINAASNARPYQDMKKAR